MAEVKPFHSSQNPGKYHICSTCTEGDNIEPKYVVQGKSGDLCKHCEARVKAGTC